MDSKHKTAAVVIIGNEILSGRTQDINLGYLGKRFAELGVILVEARVIRDIESVIIETIQLLTQQVDFVISTGGIGPTHDDITTASIAKAFELEVIEHPEARQRLLDYYSREQITDARMKMARVPAGAELIENPVSAAPGYRIDNLFVLAGVPPIMRAMFETVCHHFQGGRPIISRTVSCGLPESQLADGLSEIQAQYPDISIGSYPFARKSRMGVSIVLQFDEPLALAKASDRVAVLIRQCGGEPEVSEEV